MVIKGTGSQPAGGRAGGVVPGGQRRARPQTVPRKPSNPAEGARPLTGPKLSGQRTASRTFSWKEPETVTGRRRGKARRLVGQSLRQHDRRSLTKGPPFVFWQGDGRKREEICQKNAYLCVARRPWAQVGGVRRLLPAGDVRGGILAEHLTTRRHGGSSTSATWGVSWWADREPLAFLDATLTNRASFAPPGPGPLQPYLRSEGRPLDDAYLFRFWPDRWLLVVNGANHAKDGTG